MSASPYSGNQAGSRRQRQEEKNVQVEWECEVDVVDLELLLQTFQSKRTKHIRVIFCTLVSLSATPPLITTDVNRLFTICWDEEC